MNVRSATSDDRDSIEETARRSFRASYALSPQKLETLLDERFSPEALDDRIGRDDVELFVAEAPDDVDLDIDVSGFVELHDGDTLQWLHVHPEVRGRGVGTALVERVEDELADGSTALRARLLDRASEGTQFLERFDLYRTDASSIEVGGERFDEQLYTRDGAEQHANEPEVDVPDEVAIDDESRSVKQDEEISGTLAPFYPVFENGAFEDPIGFFCSECGTPRVAADGLDRLECNECGNSHRSDDWDKAYL